jgi:hypothetical protein
MVHSIASEKKTPQSDGENAENTFVSLYQKTNSFDAASEIICFDIYEDAVYAALSGKISIFDLSGKHQYDVEIETGVCDIVVEETAIYLLYSTKIEVYSFDGEKTDEWEACSDNTDYCSSTTTEDYLFATDAENKHIVQYDKQGGLVRFIKSPESFIIPSRAFDIISINDTLYCSNSGRHGIESYTSDGEFITSFGVAGTQAGAFFGCCNPVYLVENFNGNILTSEKGIPRISSYGKDGKFQTVLFDSNMLGGGTAAYEMAVSGENIYIASGKTISVYGIDMSCPPEVRSCGECPKRENCSK